MGIKKIASTIWKGILTPLKWVKNLTEKIWNKIPKTVRIPMFVFIFALPTWVILAFLIRRFLSNFGEGLLVETFGMLLDILVIGILILWLNETRDKKLRRELEIRRYEEEIGDYRGWDEKEATFRIVGNIKRLNKMGITEIDLMGCYLVNARLSHVNLQGANLWGVNLQGATLWNTNLQDANLMGANLQGAYLWETNLQGADLVGANLKGKFLAGTSLLGAKNFDVEQLSKVKTLYEAKLDPDLEKEIKEKYPHLLEKPEEEGE